MFDTILNQAIQAVGALGLVYFSISLLLFANKWSQRQPSEGDTGFIIPEQNITAEETPIECAPVDLALWHDQSPAEEIYAVCAAIGVEKRSNCWMTILAMRDHILGWGCKIDNDVKAQLVI